MSDYYTIPGFESMTKQDLLEMSVKHILTTRKRSTTPSGNVCVYSGSGCAAAPFLQSDKRSLADDMQHGPWKVLVKKEVVPNHHTEFITELQRCHDMAINGKDFLPNFMLNIGLLVAREGLDAGPMLWLFEE